MKNRKFSIGLALVPLLSFFIFYSSFKLIKVYKKGRILRSLRSSIQEKIGDCGLEYSFFIKDLNYPVFSLTVESGDKFPAASLIKLPILAVAFEAIEEKKMALDKKTTIMRKDIAGGSGKLKAMKLPYTLTFQELLEFMISLSDNTATNKVISILGIDYINDTFKRIGSKDSILKRKMMDFSQRRKGVENYTSSQDIAYLLERIHNRSLTNKEFSELAFSFLRNQKVNDRLPRYLPKEVVVAHKTGLEKGVVHDAGIVLGPKGDYIICVLIKGTNGYKKAKKMIAEISLITYNLYQ